MVGGLGVVHDVSRGEERVMQHLRGHLQLLRLRVLVKTKQKQSWMDSQQRQTAVKLGRRGRIGEGRRRRRRREERLDHNETVPWGGCRRQERRHAIEDGGEDAMPGQPVQKKNVPPSCTEEPSPPKSEIVERVETTH